MRKLAALATALAAFAASAQGTPPAQLPGPPPIPPPPPPAAAAPAPAQAAPAQVAPAPVAPAQAAPAPQPPAPPPAAAPWPPAPPPVPPPPPPGMAPPPPGWQQPPPPGWQQPPPPGWQQPPPPWQRPPGQRDTWYIGFGLGTGVGAFQGADDVRHSFASAVPGSATTGAFAFQLGVTLTPRLLLGFDLLGLSTTGKRTTSGCGPIGCDHADSSIGIVSAAAVATWFPMERGLFLRGGLGLASIHYDLYRGLDHAQYSRNGLGLVAGAGYAWWLGRSFNLTLGLDLLAQGYGKSEGEPRSASAAALLLGFAWY